MVIPNSVTRFDYTRGYFNILWCASVYCKSDSSIKKLIDKAYQDYASRDEDDIQIDLSQYVEYIIDDEAPTITKVAQEDNNIVITATDGEGSGLQSRAYSIDGENWVAGNKIAVEKSGQYTVYVRDALYNVSSKQVTVTISENTSNTDKEQPTKTDDTQADEVIPNTGVKLPIIFFVAIAIVGNAYRNYQKYNFKEQ